MNTLRLPCNIKVHYAGTENISDAKILNQMGINYCLYSAYPFVRRFMKSISNTSVPAYLCSNMEHVIQDSGLFTMLFGKERGDVTKKDVFQWYDALVEWTLQHSQNVTCVEVDAQSIIGVDDTWALRERMREDLPNNRIINVWHLQDGEKGLDRLIEFSDYIAIGLPELRTFSKQNYALPLAKYIKNKKNDIDIHLLGFTDFKHLNKFRFCTSCDSITWLSARRFGEIEGIYRADDFDTEKVKNMVGEEIYNRIKGKGSDLTAKAICVNLELWKHKTSRMCGDQNLKWIFNN